MERRLSAFVKWPGTMFDASYHCPISHNHPESMLYNRHFTDEEVLTE